MRLDDRLLVASETFLGETPSDSLCESVYISGLLVWLLVDIATQITMQLHFYCCMTRENTVRLALWQCLHFRATGIISCWHSNMQLHFV